MQVATINKKSKHVESSVKVYFSKDYDRFVLKKGNRFVSMTKVNNITKSVREEGLNLLKYNPIMVSQTSQGLEIEDGQHRFKASRRLGHPIFYIIVPNRMKIEEVAAINRNQNKWKNIDFVHSYISTGNAEYEYLKRFMSVTGWNLSLSASVLMGGSPHSSGSYTKKIREGSFRVVHRSAAVKLYFKMRHFRKFPLCRSRAFVAAVNFLLQSEMEYDWQRLINKFQERIDTVTHSSNYKGYMEQLESIYNHKLKNRVRLY